MEAVNTILYILIFCIGTLFGSFFTLAVYRIPLKKDITHERSFCPNCNHKLAFLDMIPILSYIFLGGKCRYCKQKIRLRYLFLEILSGLVFVLFAMSIKLNILETNLSYFIYFIFGLLYFVALFIIAGIDKEKIQIQKSVLLFGYVVEAIYIVYLYIVEKDPNVYRYVIYLGIVCVLSLIDTLLLRKKAQDSYTMQILMLCMLLVIFAGESVTILTLVLTILIILINTIAKKVFKHKSKSIKSEKKDILKIPVGFYLCVSNIICLIIANFYAFYN